MENKKVLISTQRVVKNSRWVKINRKVITKLAKEWKNKIEIPEWNFKYHFFDGTEKSCQYILILDSLNFCFWSIDEKKKWKIDFEGEKLTGYFALAASLKRAIKEGYPILEADYLREISQEDLAKIFRGEGQIPLFEKRLEILRELGRILKEKYDGQFSNLLKQVKGDALKLVESLVKNFSFFKDEAIYQGKPVYFWKKAQILVADLYGAFGGKDWGRFSNLEILTAFADYKLPQILNHFGILNYSRRLAKKIKERILIPQGSEEEIEIRSSTIWAVEFLKKALEKEKIFFSSFKIDWALWELSQKIQFSFPHHCTLTIFY